MLAGGLRQAGIVAAAGMYALDNHRQRISDDHHMAQAIAEVLEAISGVEVVARNTNMVFADFRKYDGDVAARFSEHNIVGSAHPERVRLVTHLDLPEDTPSRLAAALG